MKKQDKQDLISVLTSFENICRRHHDKAGFRHCNGCPFCKPPLYACSFYSILNGFKTYRINLMELKYGDDPTKTTRRKK